MKQRTWLIRNIALTMNDRKSVPIDRLHGDEVLLEEVSPERDQLFEDAVTLCELILSDDDCHHTPAWYDAKEWLGKAERLRDENT